MAKRGALATSGLVTVGTLLLYALTVCPTIPFGDSPELIAATACLGVAHPPGYPFYTLIGWLALQLPWGSPALLMNLLSGLFGALACGATAWLVRRLTGSTAAAVTAAGGLAFSSTFWFVSVTAEVYSLHVLLLALLLCACAVVGDTRSSVVRGRAFLAASGLLGLGLAHHPTIVVGLPAAILLGWRREGKRSVAAAGTATTSAGPISPARWLGGAALAVPIPLVLYGSLMLRALGDPPSNWGRVVSLPALAGHVGALTYRHLDLGWLGLLRPASWGHLGRLLSSEYSLWLFPLALAGIAYRPTRPAGVGPWRAPVAVLLLIMPSVAFGLRYDVEDVAVFYLPAFFGLALAAGLGTAWLLGQPPRPVALAGAVGAALFVLLTAVGNAPSRNLSGLTAAEDYARDVLDTIPRDGLLFVRSMDSFGVLYLTQVLGERPDVTVYHRQGTVFNDLLDDFGVDPIPGESRRQYAIRVEQAFIDKELQKADRRPVMFLGWPGYETPPRYRIEPVGLLHRIRRATDPLHDPGPLWSAYAERRVALQAERIGDPLALAFAATYPMARAERAFFDGDPAAAVAFFDLAVRLAREEPTILSYIGTVYGRYGDFDRAIRTLRRAVEARPTSFRAWNNLALAYELAGDPASARDALERSLDLAPGQDDVVRALSRLESGSN